MKKMKFLGLIAILVMVTSSCSKSELQNSKPISSSQTSNFDNDKGGPPPPPSGSTIDPAVGINLGNLDPRVYGSFGWADYIYQLGGGQTYLPYKTDMDENGNPYIVVGFFYFGPVEVDANGNIINPLLGSTLEIRLIDCGSNLTDELEFNNGTLVSNTNVYTTTGVIYNPMTNSNEIGMLLELKFPKEEGTKCYIVKYTTSNGQVYYRRVTIP